jgi:ketosteroid isomerase-like protein
MDDPPAFPEFRAARDRFLARRRADIEILRDAYNAFARGDIPAVLEAFDPDVDWTEPAGNPWPAHHRGHDQVVGLWRTAAERLGPSWRVVPEHFLAVEGGVMVLGEHRGQNAAGPWRVPFAMLVEMRNGKAVRFVQFCDTHLMRLAAGA